MKKTWLLPALALAALAAWVRRRPRGTQGAPAARKEPPYAL